MRDVSTAIPTPPIKRFRSGNETRASTASVKPSMATLECVTRPSGESVVFPPKPMPRPAWKSRVWT